MRRLSGVMNIRLMKYSWQRFHDLFDGWHYYRDAPKETQDIFDEIGEKSEYGDDGTGKSCTYFSFLIRSEVTKVNKIDGSIVVSFREDGFLWVSFTQDTTFSAQGGAERQRWFYERGIEIANVVMKCFSKHGLIEKEYGY